MKQAITDLQKINEEVKSQQKKKSKDEEEQDIINIAVAPDEKPQTNYEVFTDDQDSSRVHIEQDTSKPNIEPAEPESKTEPGEES